MQGGACFDCIYMQLDQEQQSRVLVASNNVRQTTLTNYEKKKKIHTRQLDFGVDRQYLAPPSSSTAPSFSGLQDVGLRLTELVHWSTDDVVFKRSTFELFSKTQSLRVKCKSELRNFCLLSPRRSGCIQVQEAHNQAPADFHVLSKTGNARPFNLSCLQHKPLQKLHNKTLHGFFSHFPGDILTTVILFCVLHHHNQSHTI